MGYRAGVVGAAGFAGIELVRLLSRHPEFDLAAATSDALAGTPIAKAYPAFTGVTDLAFSTHEDTDFSAFDVVFLAVPHKAAMGMAPDLMAAGVTVVDLSADFRLKDPAIYEKWYAPHTATDLLAQAAFGLPELTGDELAAAAERRAAGEAVLVGCAGCYPTATSLAAAPDGPAFTPGTPAFDAFQRALDQLATTLARKMAADGEGATRLITVTVRGAATADDADAAARTVANSPLVKTAVYGHDANWGRVAAALGRSGARFNQEDVDIDILGLPVCRAGLVVDFDEEEALRRFEEPEVAIEVDLHAGEESATMWTCDFSHEYVTINGDYRS